jgi:hypothetical protein
MRCWLLQVWCSAVGVCLSRTSVVRIDKRELRITKCFDRVGCDLQNTV